MPAGGLEVGESILDCLTREVQEETGLDVIHATLIALYSGPRYEYVNQFGAENKLLSAVFLVDEWRGTLQTTTDETTDARFFAPEDLPEIPALYRETLEDLRQYLNLDMVILK